MPPDPIVTPDDRYYLSERHGLWLPTDSSLPAEDASPPKEDTTEQRRESPASRVLALAICGGLALLILLLGGQVVPKPLGEVFALVPVLFVDYVSDLVGKRKFELPKSFRDITRKRTWYLSALVYAALLVIVADLEYVVLRPAGGGTPELGLLDIANGVGLGVLIGWQPGRRPVVMIVADSYGAALIGGILNLAILGQHDFTLAHDGGALISVVAVSGTVFAVMGFFGYLALAGWRRLRPPRLLLSPDRHYVWDGAMWRQVGPDGHSYSDGKRQVPFTPRLALGNRDRKLCTHRSRRPDRRRSAHAAGKE